MRAKIEFAILCSILVAIAVLLGKADHPRDDDLARSIVRLLEKAR